MKLFTHNTLVIATHNDGKLQEIKKLFEKYDVRLISSASIGLSEPKEDQDTFLGNARIKAHYASKKSGLAALSDDSGLEVECLNGAPGVFTADWAKTNTGRDFTLAMHKLWSEVSKTNYQEPYSARFVCTLVIAWPNGEDKHFVGEKNGTLVWPIRGKNGHGFDPIFLPNGYKKTFGEMDRWKKNVISHRGIAFKKFEKYFFMNSVVK